MLGKYNYIKDELGHFVFALVFPLILLYTDKITFMEGVIMVVVAALIDLDHLLNPIIGKILGETEKITILPKKKSAEGYAIKLFHGLDLFIIYAFATFSFTRDFYLSLGIFLNLIMHHTWDFLVYNHSWKELFFLTRLKAGFKPGERKHYRDIIFSEGSVFN